MSKSIVFSLWFLLNFIQFIAAGIIPNNAEEAAVLEKVRQHPEYQKVAEKKESYRKVAVKEDAKSQAAYAKAKNSCMPGGNCFRNIEGRFHEHKFNKNTRKGKLEVQKLDQIENRAINSLNAHLVQSHLGHATH